LARKVSNKTVTSLILAVKSTSLDEEKAKPIFNTFLDVQSAYIEEASELLDGFDKVVKASVKSLDKDTIKETLGWLAGISAKADHKNDASVSKVRRAGMDPLEGGEGEGVHSPSKLGRGKNLISCSKSANY
jgi:hypothetical protein